VPIIRVDMLTGRDAATRRAFAEALTDAAERSLGVSRQSVRVILNEVAPENFVVAGTPKSEDT